MPVLTLGLPDDFIEHGDPAKLLALCGLDAAGIEQSILRRFGATPALVRSVGRRHDRQNAGLDAHVVRCPPMAACCAPCGARRARA